MNLETKIPSYIHPSWLPYLTPLFERDEMKYIQYTLLSEAPFYPDPQNIFRVFSMPLSEIKVVILGQDPYPNGEAIGLAFAVEQNSKFPASLRVIQKEVYRDTDIISPPNQTLHYWGTLDHWTTQGVFLLNTALTVKQKGAGSHLKAWEWFTIEVIRIISEHNPCIWMLWGAKAQAFKPFIHTPRVTGIEGEKKIPLNEKYNYILNAPHPAAELYGGSNKFSGCNHFNLCNQILQSQNKQLINW